MPSSCSNNSERLISKSALIKPINERSRFYYHILFADNYALVHKCSLPDISIFLSHTSEKLSSSSWLVLNLIPWFPSSFGRLAHNKSISTGRSPVGKDGLQPSQALFCQPHPNCGICSASPLSSSLTVGHVQFHAYLLTELHAFKPHWCHRVNKPIAYFRLFWRTERDLLKLQAHTRPSFILFGWGLVQIGDFPSNASDLCQNI